MVSSRISGFVFPVLLIARFISAQPSTSSGYTGYSLSLSGDPDSVIYSTSSTPANVSTTVPKPDVYLNATVHVGEIDLAVPNLTAKVNLGAQVLQLLAIQRRRGFVHRPRVADHGKRHRQGSAGKRGWRISC